MFLKYLKTNLLYSKKKVILTGTCDKRLKNSDTAPDRTDENLTDRIDKIANVINQEKSYRIPLRFLCDICFLNHPIKFDSKINWNLRDRFE